VTGDEDNPMVYQTLNYQKKESVGTISILGPLDNQVKLVRLSDELTELCDVIAWDEEIRAVIVAGVEEISFSMRKGSSGAASKANEEEALQFSSIAEPIAKLDKPVVAAINGNVIGQGLELALACDIKIAAEASRFGLPHIREGLIPWDGGTQRLSRLIGRGKALEMILTGEMIDFQEAYRIGLVNKIVPSEELMATAMNMAREMASKGSIALRYAKEAIYKGMDLTLEQGLRLEADLYLLLHTTRDRTEGIQAFREKKTPKFEGK
jgi:enoyl-CoA hydratase/carnithine racemase